MVYLTVGTLAIAGSLVHALNHVFPKVGRKWLWVPLGLGISASASAAIAGSLSISIMPFFS